MGTNASTLSITQATALIGQALKAGQIDRDTAIRAQRAIRGDAYGHRMTGQSRARVLSLRFGIVAEGC